MTGSLEGEIRDGRHQMRVRVYFEDTDSGQIVYHASFLRFMERGRTNYLRLLGMNQQELLKEARRDVPGFAFVVRSMSIDFQKPAILDDLLEVITVPEDVRGRLDYPAAGMQAWRRSFSHGPRARRLYLRRKGATYPEGAAAHHGRGVEKSTLVHAFALHRPNGIKQLISCCDIVRQEFSGIVYHANYLRYMERGRTNHLRLMGAEQQALFDRAETEGAGFAFVVRSMHLDFLKPARMDDVLDVVTWPVAVKGASIMLAQEVRRGEDVLVKAEVRVAFISGGRAQPIPKSIRTLMKADLIS